MHSTMMIRQILEVNKRVFEESLSAMVAFQEHVEKIMRIFWEKSAFFPVENKNVMESSMHTVVEKSIPVSQAYEVTKSPAARGKKEGISVKKTFKKKQAKLDKIK